MFPLGRIVDGTSPQTFTIDATPSCKVPWIVDVDAELLAAGLEVRGVPGSLRIGCGPVQHVDLVTTFGVQRVVVYGAADFDVRIVAAELGIIRTELERIFAVHIARRWLDEVVVEPIGSRPLPHARATTTGLRVGIEAGRAWDAAPRLEVGSTVARIWLAKTFEVIAAAPEPSAAHLGSARCEREAPDPRTVHLAAQGPGGGARRRLCRRMESRARCGDDHRAARRWTRSGGGPSRRRPRAPRGHPG